MVFVTDLHSFMQSVETLFAEKPNNTRMTMKYRHCDGQLIVKVTDDVKCFQYRTDQKQEAKLLTRLNGTLMKKLVEL
eukprot:m.16543 g.16543  ORF g.16543 m.16543 type:complete len:77 (+) comp8019_c0_seq1:78-308(+)